MIRKGFQMDVDILDYGMGNIKSVYNGFKLLGAEPNVVDIPGEMSADRLIVPGVGSFGDAMENLEPFVPDINELLELNGFLLGICLGMQVFFQDSEESPGIKGLGLLKGRVKRIEADLKLPHIGWNSLEVKKRTCPLFKGIENGYVYYANTYYVRPREDIVTATSDYGTKVTASVQKGNIYGTQFHPEKSGKFGLKILENFLEL